MNKNKLPKVSIVIPTFNRANMVSKAIDTALSQTYPCQIIVCDHGSKDNTPEIIKKYGNQIIYIRREKDFGPHFCWLEGVLNADGEYVHIQMDDDWMEPTFIEETVKLMDDDVGMVFSDAYLNYLEENTIKKNCLSVKKRFGYGKHPIKTLEKAILEDKYMLSPAVCLYRKKDIVDALYQGDLPINFGEKYFGVGPDHFMTLQSLLRYKYFACVDKSLIHFAYHKGSITVNAYQEKNNQNRIFDAYESIRKYYLLLKIYKENKNILNYDKSILNTQEITYKILGLPLFYIKQNKNKIKYFILHIQILKIKLLENKKRIYILGIPLISRTIKK